MNWKDINYEKMGSAISSSLALMGQSTQNQSRIYSLNQQLELNEEKFEIEQANRDRAITKTLTDLQASESRRGVIGATSGMQEGVVEEAERRERLSFQEMLATERNIEFAIKLEEVAQKNQKMNAMIGVANAAFGGLSDMSLGVDKPSMAQTGPADAGQVSFAEATKKPLMSPTPETKKIQNIFEKNKPLFSPIKGGLV